MYLSGETVCSPACGVVRQEATAPASMDLMTHAQDAPVVPASAAAVRTNWAGNYAYTASQLLQPASVEEATALVRTLPLVKGLGARHSFNHIADTSGTQIDLGLLNSMQLDREGQTVWVGAGVRYGELAPWRDAQGFAVHNLASLPHISVAGACATGTHGSGLNNGCLSTAVVGLELIDGNGELSRITAATHGDRFRAAVVGLGAMGVITAVQLKVIPAFEIAQTVYEDLSFDELRPNLRAIFGAAYSVSLFTDWQGHRATQAWVKRRVEPGERQVEQASFFGARRQTTKLHPLPGLSAENCTEQMGEPGPWCARLPHFRIDYTPSAGAELQTEYFVPFDRAVEAIAAVEELRDDITPHLLTSELRTVAADSLPMSMAYRRESLAIHFTWKQEVAAVLALLPRIEAKLARFGARPHWAKLFTLPGAQLRTLYPELDGFVTQARTHDPAGKFRNAFLAELLG